MLRQTRSSLLAVITAVAAIAGCAGDVTPPPGGEGVFNVTANVSQTTVAMVVVVVTGPGITTPLTFNLTISGGVASGTVTIPAGADRTIAMHAYDNSGIETHQGSVTVNVSAGANPPVSLVLTPLTGDAPITATLGTVVVTVSPPSAPVVVAATVNLIATITANGSPISGTVLWATTNPGIATVSNSGVVTGVAPGTTAIVATFQGVAGASTITVGP
jgi:hypothetical protein